MMTPTIHATLVVGGLFACLSLSTWQPAEAEQPQQQEPASVLPDGQHPDDSRRGPLKTLDGHFPFDVPGSAQQWQKRSDSLRRRVLVATGLWPMPEKTPLNPVVHGKVQRDGFTVERVYFESLPGHFVTGLLFRPSGSASSGNSADQPRPGVLCPHGHGGRSMRYNDQQIAELIASGAEHFEKSGRTPKLARCAQLARMGCVSFIFDMLGYADSVQIPYEVAHRHADRRPAEIAAAANKDDTWPFYSIQADSRLQSIMQLQTWNAIRALDFLASLDDVDADRLAVTGGSGGGTQTILLGAIDPRVKVSFPNGMVSTSMQGGCYCENCNLLRIGTGNVELAALFAPRPQAMTAADDWTRDMMTDGFPELKQLYAMLGAESNVACRPLLQFPHNYNYVTRATMYQWMNEHLNLGLHEPIIETDFEPLSESEMAVWNDEHPQPTNVGIEHERAVLKWLDEQAEQVIETKQPKDADSLDAYDQLVGSAWRVLFDQGGEPARVPELDELSREQRDGSTLRRCLVRSPSRGVEIPVLLVQPNHEASDTENTPEANSRIDGRHILIWTDPVGKVSGFQTDGEPVDPLRRWLDRGVTVMLPDLFGQGEASVEGVPPDEQRLIDDPRAYSAFTFGYNRPLAAKRAADLSVLIALASQGPEQSVSLLARRGSAAWALPAAMLAGPKLAAAAIDTAGERFADVKTYSDADFVPGAVKYGDFPALVALRAPYPLRVLGESDASLELAKESYEAVDAGEELVIADQPLDSDSTYDWLMNHLSQVDMER